MKPINLFRTPKNCDFKNKKKRNSYLTPQQFFCFWSDQKSLRIIFIIKYHSASVNYVKNMSFFLVVFFFTIANLKNFSWCYVNLHITKMFREYSKSTKSMKPKIQWFMT